MLFKQIQLFKLTSPMQSSPNALAEKLLPFEFKPCLPSMPSSFGWVSPIDEEGAPLTRGLNGCIMITLQIEEKIMPASVVALALKDKVKQIELSDGRRIRRKEKLTLKDDVVMTLLPRAFSKFTRINAYIDTRNGWLILNSTSASRTETFISMLKKAIGDGIEAIEVAKPSSIITHWLKSQDYPKEFSIEKSCTLQDPNQQNRVIRCQQQDLFAGSIQDLVKDGCEAIQIGLCWQDRLSFVMANDFSIRSMHVTDDDTAEIKDELETKQQKFDADFIMMTEMFTGLFTDLLNVFAAKNQPQPEPRFAIAV